MKTKTLSSLLMFIALATFAGCAGVTGNAEDAVKTAGQTSGDYTTLNAAIGAGITRIDNLRNANGTPDTYAQTVKEIDRDITTASDNLRSSRSSLLATGAKQIDLLKEEAGKFTDSDLRTKLTKDAETLRGKYAKFDKDSANVTDSLVTAHGYAEDIRRMLDLNRTDSGVKSTLGTLDKIEDAIKDAQKKIPDAKDALEDLRKELPRPASN